MSTLQTLGLYGVQLTRDPAKKYILHELPPGYELRKYQAGQGQTERTHFQLFGHPVGPTFKYRTPGEFGLHLLWLMSESVDRNNCSCELCDKLCKKFRDGTATLPPSKQATAVSGPSQPSTRTQPQVKPPQQQQQAQQQQQPQVQQGQQRGQQQQQQQQLQQQEQQLQLPSMPVVQNKPSTLPASKPVWPFLGQTSRSNVFRIGEMVWFKHAAWRLGLIYEIVPKDGTQGGDDQYHFRLAQLGHTVLNLPNVAKEAFDMRPFLTFSVPASQAEFVGQSFDALDWQGIAQRRRQNTDPAVVNRDLQMLGLEASKMAARAVNNSFSPFNPLDDQAGLGFSVRAYGGLFFGAELINLNDPLRVQPPASVEALNRGDDGKKKTTVMMVKQILLDANYPRTLRFTGPVYILHRHYPTPSAGENHDELLAEEVNFRNNLLTETERTSNGRWTWFQVEGPTAVRTEKEAYGRFYVSHKLLKTINETEYNQALEARSLKEPTAWVNSRSENGAGAANVGLRPDRKSSVGLAIPRSTAINLPESIKEQPGV